MDDEVRDMIEQEVSSGNPTSLPSIPKLEETPKLLTIDSISFVEEIAKPSL